MFALLLSCLLAAEASLVRQPPRAPLPAMLHRQPSARAANELGQTGGHCGWSQQLSILMPRLCGKALQRAAASMPPTASPRTLSESLAQLEQVGFNATDVLKLAQKRPTAVGTLATRTPGPMLEMLSQLGISDSAGVLRAQPSIVTLDAPRVVAAAAFISRYVGGVTNIGDFVSAHPQSLLWRDDDASVIAEHLRSLGVPSRAVERASAAFPRLAQLTSAENVDALWNFFHVRLGIGTRAFGKMIETYPQLLGLSFDGNVRPKMAFLAEELGVDAVKVISRHPQVLGLALDANLRPTVDHLQRSGVDVRRAVDGHPSLLSLSLRGKIVPTMEYLRSLGMKAVGRALSAQPALLSLSVASNLQPKVSFLRTLGLDSAPGGLGAQLDSYPALLSLSLDSNLRPTADALLCAGLIDTAIPRGAATASGAPDAEVVALRPRHLAASLEGRVRPRLALCALLRRLDAKGRRSSSGRADGRRASAPTLNSVTTLSDCKFARQVCGPSQPTLLERLPPRGCPPAWRITRRSIPCALTRPGSFVLTTGGDRTVGVPALSPSICFAQQVVIIGRLEVSLTRDYTGLLTGLRAGRRVSLRAGLI